VSRLQPYSFFQHDEEAPTAQLQPPVLRPAALRVRAPRRHDGVGLGISIVLHLAVLAGLLLNPVGRSFGAYGPDMGTGMAVSLVAGFAAGGPQAEPTPSEPAEPEMGEQNLQREAVLPVGAGAEAKDTPQEAEAQDARPQTPRLAMMRVNATSKAANAFDGLTGASDSLGGDSTATSDILAQIARCLPPDFRPNLGFSQLALSIGPDGRLTTAPSMKSALPALTAEGRLMADRIVQAALLCGPYAHPDAVGRAITLAADFSQVPPALEAPGSLPFVGP